MSNNLKQKLQDLQIQKMKLDKFFSMYLEKFEKKMDPDNTNTSIWKLYKEKLKEYDKIDYEIKSTNYWINKNNHV
jgi:hypothetical protein